MISLKFSSFIDSFQLRTRKERVLPFFFIAIFYGVVAYMFISKITGLAPVILTAISALAIAIAVVTFYLMICVHSAALAGVVGFILGIMVKFPSTFLFYPLLVGILALGAVMSARLMMNAHTLTEVSVGAGLGFVFCFGSIAIFT